MASHFVMTQYIGRDLEDLNNIIKKLWEIEGEEEFLLGEKLTPEEQKALNIATNSLMYEDGRYQLKLPWKDNVQLDNNYELALNRLEHTEKRLLKNNDLGKQYASIIEEYARKGYIEKVDDLKNVNSGWYLPHFPVVRPEKETTKVRIVFDGAAKFNGKSLNDAIHQGPKLQQDLVKVLLRFRRSPVALICDISKMYLQIGTHPDDRKYAEVREVFVEKLGSIFKAASKSIQQTGVWFKCITV